MNTRSTFLALVSVLGLSHGFSRGQPAPPAVPVATQTPRAADPVPSPAAPAVEQIAPAEPPAPPNPYLGDAMTRLRASGDWFGTRSALADRGLTFDLFATQFHQGVARGGREQDFEYGGKLDYLLNVDGQKLGLWQGFFVGLHAETRYGQSTNEIDGALTPSNISLTFPRPDSNITSLTGLKFTQALSENFALYFGKINTLDEYPLSSTARGWAPTNRGSAGS